MVKHFDHLTIVVRDTERAKTFFAVLGFKEATSVTIAGDRFASYMSVPGIEAEHVTLVLDNVSPRTEIQLLRYRHSEPLPDPHIRDLNKLGMNHICFAVGDIEAEVAALRANGFKTRNEIMDFHSRKLVFNRRPRRRHRRALAVALRGRQSAPSALRARSQPGRETRVCAARDLCPFVR
jgi:catechol 2,3-dioxygenase-like lactoylglutathione lyase family enzyme